MQRRGFLNLILASAAAPAIVKADGLMKIWVPSQGIQVVGGLITAEMIARESFQILRERLAFLGSVNMDYMEGIRSRHGM